MPFSYGNEVINQKIDTYFLKGIVKGWRELNEGNIRFQGQADGSMDLFRILFAFFYADPQQAAQYA